MYVKKPAYQGDDESMDSQRAELKVFMYDLRKHFSWTGVLEAEANSLMCVG